MSNQNASKGTVLRVGKYRDDAAMCKRKQSSFLRPSVMSTHEQNLHAVVTYGLLNQLILLDQKSFNTTIQ
jgi:hypothetical protein